MPNKVDATIITAAWGVYWEKYGDKWTQSILKLNPQPNEVIVVSDKPVDTIFKNVTTKKCHLGVFRNIGVRFATSEWIVFSDLDDEPFDNYLVDLDSNFDIIAFNLQYETDGGYCYSSINDWNNILDLDVSNPIVSTSAVKRDMLLKTPFRKIGWEDWALWVDLKVGGARARFDRVIRYKYNNTPNSLSKQDAENKDKEIKNLKIKHQRRL
jgi:glycosyltransferase involved in cell wall biosynthesis